MPGAIEALKKRTWPEAGWTAKDKPVLVLDGVVHRVADLRAPVHGEAAYVVGVGRKRFPLLCEHLRVASLHLYEMRVEALQPLAALRDLRQLAIRWNTKLADLSPLRELTALETLVLEDTPKVRDLAPLASLTRLRALEHSGGIWNKNHAESLAPLAELPALEELVLTNLRVTKGGLRPLAACRSLRSLRLSNQFRTEDYAFLSVELPDVRCELFAPWVKVPAIDGKDVMVVGRRKPFLSSQADAARLARYERAFGQLQRTFAAEREARAGAPPGRDPPPPP